VGGEDITDRVVSCNGAVSLKQIQQMKATPKKITLIGAGLNGPLLAVLLMQRGFAVEIFERRSDMRRVQISAGRSINLALSTRGIHALQQAGLWEGMRSIIIPMKGRMMHSVTGELTFQPYGKNESEVINSISRAELNIELMSLRKNRVRPFASIGAVWAMT